MQAMLTHLREVVLKQFYDGARDESVWYIRLYYFEDLAVAYIIAALGAAYPSTRAGCTADLGAMLVVSLLHLAYLLGVKPYAEKVEQWLSVFNAGLNIAVALLSIATLNDTSAGDDPSSSKWGTALGWALLGTSLFFFVQLCILVVASLFYRANKKKKGKKDGEADGDGDEMDALQVEIAAGDDTTARPLLTVPAPVQADANGYPPRDPYQPASAEDGVQRANPLAQHQQYQQPQQPQQYQQPSQQYPQQHQPVAAGHGHNNHHQQQAYRR